MSFFFFLLPTYPKKAILYRRSGYRTYCAMYRYRHGAACDFELLCLWWSTRYLHHITSSHIRNRTWLHWCRCFNRTMWFNLHLVTTGFVWQYFGFEVLYGRDIAWNSRSRRVRNRTRLPSRYQEIVRNRTRRHCYRCFNLTLCLIKHAGISMGFLRQYFVF